MVVPVDVAAAARAGNFAVVQAYFASGPRDVEDHCEIGPGLTIPAPLLTITLTPNFGASSIDEEGKIRVIELLLTRGADPNGRNGWGYVPLGYPVSHCEVDGTPRMVKLLLDSGADARVMGYERSGITISFVGSLLTSSSRALGSGVARPFKNHLEVLKMLLRAGASLDTCKAGVPGDPTPKDAEWCIQKAETQVGYGPRLLADADWIAMKTIVAGVRREGSWKAYCRVEHKRFLRLRSLLVRGRAKTTDARVDRILRLPNGACWTVLAYWREAA